jgi:hypothetical protein
MATLRSGGVRRTDPSQEDRGIDGLGYLQGLASMTKPFYYPVRPAVTTMDKTEAASELHSAEIARQAINAAIDDFLINRREPWKKLYRNR